MDAIFSLLVEDPGLRNAASPSPIITPWRVEWGSKMRSSKGSTGKPPTSESWAGWGKLSTLKLMVIFANVQQL